MRGVVAGMQLLATYNGSNYMFGTITAVTATQVTMTVASGFTTGSGTYSSWTLQPCGPPGAVSFASDAQAKAGASTSVAITPANLAAVISALMGKRSDVSTSAALSAFTRSRVTASVSPTLPTFAADEWLIVERDTTAGDVTIVCSAQTIDGVAADFVMDRNKDIILFYCTSAGVVVTKYLGVLPT